MALQITHFVHFLYGGRGTSGVGRRVPVSNDPGVFRSMFRNIGSFFRNPGTLSKYIPSHLFELSKPNPTVKSSVNLPNIYF